MSVFGHSLLRIATAGVLATLPSLSGAREPDVAATLERWGLMGTWSTDCAAPPGGDNTVYTYVRRGGGVFLDRDGYRFKDSSPITRARVLPDGMIEYRVEFRAGGRRVVQINTYAKRADGRIRIFFNRRVDGETTVENGRLAHTGEETAWREKCAPGQAV